VARRMKNRGWSSPSEDEQGEGSAAADESASSGEVAAAQNNSEQMRMYHTGSRAKLLRSKT